MLKNIILEKRPNLSKTSVNTYNSTLTNLYKKIWGNGDIDVDKFNDVGKVMNKLKDMPVNKRKSILSALVVLSEKKEYRDQMLDDIKEYNIETAKQQKTENQKESWVSNDDIKNKYEELKKNAMLVWRKPKLTIKDKQDIQDFVILSLMGGIFIPPRRLKDFVDFKLHNIDKAKDNYRHAAKLYFNSYKTAKTYGKQVIPIPLTLARILKRWEIINDKDYLFYDSKGNQLTNVKLNQRLNKMFGKKVSVNQLRHTYLTHKYGSLINEKHNLKEDFKMMGSSIAQELVYIKET
jgi:site-specific recombinase XerD